MNVTPINRISNKTMDDDLSASNLKQLMQKLGNALDSGNLSDAKDVLAKLQKNAPTQAGNGGNPLITKIETLSKSIESGDLKGAQAAYADIKSSISQDTSSNAKGNIGGAKASLRAGGISGTSKIYDERDASRDGKVSISEEFAYSLTHTIYTNKASATTKTDDKAVSLDTTV